MDFWSIFLLFIIVSIMTLVDVYNIYTWHKDKKTGKIKKWFVYITSTISSIALIVCSSLFISHSFDKCVKTAYYNGVSVKTIPKLKSDYTIEKVDSVFYINKMRE